MTSWTQKLRMKGKGRVRTGKREGEEEQEEAKTYMKTIVADTILRMASCPAQWMILIRPAMRGSSRASETAVFLIWSFQNVVKVILLLRDGPVSTRAGRGDRADAQAVILLQLEVLPQLLRQRDYRSDQGHQAHERHALPDLSLPRRYHRREVPEALQQRPALAVDGTSKRLCDGFRNAGEEDERLEEVDAVHDAAVAQLVPCVCLRLAVLLI